MTRRTIAFNEKGNRIGQGHGRAKLTDHEVDCIRELHEEHGAPYDLLLDWFDVSKTTIASICRYEIRAQTPHDYKDIDE